MSKKVNSEILKSFNHCYGLNYGPSKLICWSPNSSRSYTGNRIFRDVILNEAIRTKPWSDRTNVLTKEKETPENPFSVSYEDTAGRQSSANRKRALIRNLNGQNLDLGLFSPQKYENKFLLFKPTDLVVWLWQPQESKTII